MNTVTITTTPMTIAEIRDAREKAMLKLIAEFARPVTLAEIMESVPDMPVQTSFGWATNRKPGLLAVKGDLHRLIRLKKVTATSTPPFGTILYQAAGDRA